MSKDIGETARLIQQAVRSLGQDFATSNIRGLLLAALRECDHVSKKRHRRERNAMQEAATKAKNMHNEWWERIQENVRQQARAEAEKPEENVDFGVDL